MAMNPTPPTPTVRHISDCFIKSQFASDESRHPYYLGPWDLAMLTVHYIQKGLLFPKPPNPHPDPVQFTRTLISRLKTSLSTTLVHFFPLAGRLATIKNENEPSCVIFVDCYNSPGARFIHAALDMTMADILSPTDVPLVVQSFFDHDRAVNCDGHTMALLSIKLTELLDGFFIGCSMNHCIGDGTSYWNFFNAWSEIFQKQSNTDNNFNVDSIPTISKPPILKRWFPEGYGPIINLPFTSHKEFINRFEAPQLRERTFHFTSESIAKLKAKANTEHNTNEISSFQSLSALAWRCITRVRNLPKNQITSCRLAANNRLRLKPPLPESYFGNAIYLIIKSTTAGELLEHDLGWAAWRLHAVIDYNDKVVREFVDGWLRSPAIYSLGPTFDPFSVMMGSSARFNKYGNEFGLGKAVALRSGYANKFDGKVSSYPGSEGGGSVDLEVCLPPESMSALEIDEEFMDAVCFLDHQIG